MRNLTVLSASSDTETTCSTVNTSKCVEFSDEIDDDTSYSSRSSETAILNMYTDENLEQFVHSNKDKSQSDWEVDFLKRFNKRQLQIFTFENIIRIVIDVRRIAGRNIELLILDNSNLSEGYLTCIRSKDISLLEKMDTEINARMNESNESISHIPR